MLSMPVVVVPFQIFLLTSTSVNFCLPKGFLSGFYLSTVPHKH